MILIAQTPSNATFIQHITNVNQYKQSITRFKLHSDELILCDDNKAIEYINQFKELFNSCGQFTYDLNDEQKCFVYDLLSLNVR